MRLGLISDLHGNRLALEAVLEDLEEAGIDRLVCLGDVAAGPEPRATIDHDAPRGADGLRGKCMEVSCSMRSRLRTLHGRQAATTFSHVCAPPFERGTT